MLTGDQIAAGRRLAGIRSQAELAVMAGVSRPTVERAEAARALIPSMNCDAMARIIRALETAGIVFSLFPGGSLAGGIGLRFVDPLSAGPSADPVNPSVATGPIAPSR